MRSVSIDSRADALGDSAFVTGAGVGSGAGAGAGVGSAANARGCVAAAAVVPAGVLNALPNPVVEALRNSPLVPPAAAAPARGVVSADLGVDAPPNDPLPPDALNRGELNPS